MLALSGGNLPENPSDAQVRLDNPMFMNEKSPMICRDSGDKVMVVVMVVNNRLWWPIVILAEFWYIHELREVNEAGCAIFIILKRELFLEE